jgi:hypothetical protein
MSNDKTREEFETWAATKGMAMHLARSESGLYVSRVTQNYMDCWMASRIALADMNAARTAMRHVLPDVPGDSLDEVLFRAFEAAGLQVNP